MPPGWDEMSHVALFCGYLAKVGCCVLLAESFLVSRVGARGCEAHCCENGALAPISAVADTQVL